MEFNIGFLGAGAMAEALIDGLLKVRLVATAQIIAYDIRRERLQHLQQVYGLEPVASREELLHKAEVIILAVKPQNIHEVLSGLNFKGKLVISIVAGLTLARLARLAGEVPLVRAMPNTPSLVGEGMAALAKNEYVSQADLDKALAIFRSVGQALVLPEEQFDAVTGLSGSGPAYVYLFIEALADAGVKQGLARQVALQLAAQTVLGSARMVLASGEHPAVLKDRVASPAGTTIAGLAVLEEQGFRGTIMRAVEAASLRSQSLGKEKSLCK